MTAMTIRGAKAVMKTKLDKIHQTSMAILEKVGIKLHDPDICQILQKKGITVKDGIAFFTESQVMKYVIKAPKQFKTQYVNR